MALLERLITRLEEGRNVPLKHSLLIVSGIEDKRIGNKYLEKFDKIKKNYCSFEAKNIYNPYKIQKAKLLSEYLTENVKYKKNKFLFHEIIDARLSKNPFLKHGNCVGLTSLYNALAEEEGINTGIYKERDHVLSRVISFGKEYAVENTSPFGFNVRLKGPIGKGSNLDLLATVLCSRDFDDTKKRLETFNLAKRISPRTSLIYFNIAISHSYLGDFKNALNEMDKAIQIDPFNPEQYKFRSYIKRLLKDKKGAKEDKKKFIELKHP